LHHHCQHAVPPIAADIDGTIDEIAKNFVSPSGLPLRQTPSIRMSIRAPLPASFATLPNLNFFN
jgi:hypothetical protein